MARHPEQPSRPGRPTKYTRSLARTLCDRLIEGHSLNQICADPLLPSKQTVLTWVRTREDFREQYLTARELQAHGLVDESIDAVRRVLPENRPLDADGNPIEVNLYGLQVYASHLLKVAQMLAPKVHQRPGRSSKDAAAATSAGAVCVLPDNGRSSD